MKRIVVDLDGTLTVDEKGVPYPDKRPNLAFIDQLRAYRELGFEIIVATARNMNTYQNSVGLITAKTLPVIFAWLEAHQIPYDEIHVGKPWCGHAGFYVDDKAIRPSEFCRLSYDEIMRLLAAERTSERQSPSEGGEQ